MPPSGMLTGGRSKPSDRISSVRHSSEKEAIAISRELTQLLEKRDPWHQDVVFARENLRRHCLALIFTTPKEGDAAATASGLARRRLQGLNLLFLVTSHNIIHQYRQRLAAADKAIASGAAVDDNAGKTDKRGRGAHAGSSSSGSSRHATSARVANSNTTPSQRKRLAQSFRDFLGKEEAFWRDLLVRIVGVFNIEEARAALRILDMDEGDWEPDVNLDSSKGVHDQAILLCHRTLVCYGDLARYKEMYSDAQPSQTSSRGGHSFQQRRPRGGKLAPAAPSNANNPVKDWSRSYQAYHQARLLVPDDGNPYNQLAVISGYKHDTLASVYYYYRALCVKKAFPAAQQNLASVLKKAMVAYEAEKRKEQDVARLRAADGSYADIDDDRTPGARSAVNPRTGIAPAKSPEALVDSLKKIVVTFHALLLKEPDTVPSGNPVDLAQQFGVCIRSRLLPSDVIVKVAVMAIGSWWCARMYRSDQPSVNKKGKQVSAETKVDHTAVENTTLLHTLAIFTELCKVAYAETCDVQLHETLQAPATAPPAERSMLLATSITAVHRRMLPALRILGMWASSSADYLAAYDTTAATYRASDNSKPLSICDAVKTFWYSYSVYVNALTKTFPQDILPLTAGDLMLEEDIDMLGFAPLKRRLKDAAVGKAAQGVSAAIAASAKAMANLHPNEEQVLRIGDLLAGANLLAQSESCPVIIENGIFVLRKKKLNPTSEPWNPVKSHVSVAAPAADNTAGQSDYVDEEDDGYPGFESFVLNDNDEEDMDFAAASDVAGDEDVLDLAMRVATGEQDRAGLQAANNDDEDDDDEEVLYPTRAIVQQIQASLPIGRPASTHTPSPPIQSRALSTSQLTASGPGRTASDLLLQVLSGNSLENFPNPPAAPFSLTRGSTVAAGFPSSSPSLTAQQNTGPTRSIWASASQVPVTAPSLGHQRSSGGMGSGSAAEALFNSMPNQNQASGQQQSSPIMAAANRIASSGAGAFGAIGSGAGTSQPSSPKRQPGPAAHHSLAMNAPPGLAVNQNVYRRHG